MVDASTHTLVPNHTLLDDSELEEILEEYHIEKTDLPKIKRTDPGLPKEADTGDVVKITRNSRTTDQAVIYRLVVE